MYYKLSDKKYVILFIWFEVNYYNGTRTQVNTTIIRCADRWAKKSMEVSRKHAIQGVKSPMLPSASHQFMHDMKTYMRKE